MTPVITVYSRAGCHLCEEAVAQLGEIQAPAFTLRVVDIESDDELLSRYLERIPVIALDGEELYDFHLDEADLVRRLAAADGG